MSKPLVPDDLWCATAPLLPPEQPKRWGGRPRVLWFVNRQRYFDNLDGTEYGLRDLLAASFQGVDGRVQGTVAVFAARRPRGTDGP